MADDWDLLAVVRGCCSSATTSAAGGPITTATNAAVSSNFQPQDHQDFAAFPDPPSEPSTSNNGNFQELNDLFFRPFFPNSQLPRSKPASVFGGLLDLSPPSAAAAVAVVPAVSPPQQRPKQSLAVAHNPSPRSKRRKNQMKRVCEVPVEGLSSDMWSWRKYGQKPIKGSPYPRGYYKCSTSKGCLARKQVERNRSDPGMFIVTYTAEHNHPVPTHRNSLAGSTRQKGEVSESGKHGSPPAVSPAPAPVESREEVAEDEEDDELSVSDMVIGDDFFEGLEGLAGDSSSDQAPANTPFQWLANSVTPTAAGEC